MNKLLFLVAAMALSGCTLLNEAKEVVFPVKFDAGEYDRISKIRTSIALGTTHCSDSTQMKKITADLYSQVVDLMVYSQGLSGDAATVKIESDLNKEVNGLYNHYQVAVINPVSEAYCKDVMASIERSAEDIQHFIGKKPKS